jgi:hypothetical protein
MFKLKQLILATALLSASLSTFAATYYVSKEAIASDSTGTGTELKPFATLAKVAGLATLAPGDTILIKNGTYAPFKLTKSGAEGAHITWKAYPGHKPEVRHSGNSWSVIEVQASYQTIDGLTLTGNNDSVTLAQAEAAISPLQVMRPIKTATLEVLHSTTRASQSTTVTVR